MRDWLIMGVILGPALALCILQQGGEVPTWAWVLAGGWAAAGGIVVGWYEGWINRVLVGMLVFVPFAVALAWIGGGEGAATWPTWLNLLLIAGPIVILVLVGSWTGWFSHAAKGLKQMFAKHPAGCQQCFSLRKDLVWFELPADTTGGSERRSLCPDCVWTEMETRLAGLSNRLLIAEPVRNANGYYSLNADGIREWWASEGDRAEKEATTRRVFAAVEQMVDQVAGQCEECGSREANICWVPAEAFRSKWDRFSDLLGHKPDKLLSIGSRRFLCGGCTGRTAREAAQATRLRLYLVTPPASDTLVMLPGEA